MDKIVVTGLGVASAFGNNLNSFWEKLYAGEKATRSVEEIDLDKIYCKVAAQIAKDESLFPWEKWGKKLPSPRAGKFIVLGMEAAYQALLDALLISSDSLHVDPKFKMGVVAGSGIGGLEEVYQTSKKILEQGADRISPFFVPSALINLLPGMIAIEHKIKGVNQSQVTACATGAHAIADAARLIREGRADIIIAGASEAAIGRIGLAGFCALKALVHGFNDRPSEASRPFDKARAGFVMGDGAGMMVLERESHAIARGAKIYCEYIEAGLTGDANHITAPCEDGDGAIRAMKEALDRSGLLPKDIGYINAHSTSTGIGDLAELKAIKSVFSESWGDISVSSIKGAIGHLLGAAGAVEAIASVLCLKNGMVLPTVNLENPDEEAYLNGKLLDLVPKVGKKKDLDYVLSNAFGFGGVNISLIFGKYAK
jgi:3-oxoacyl-[acyl-carrier-protein] synthase II